MKELIWRAIAYIASRTIVTDWLIARAVKTPYSHIYGKDGNVYMGRWWLFNRYDQGHTPWLPSVRVHYIVKPDDGRHLHDHPWDARTIILIGGYREIRGTAMPEIIERKRGDTCRIRHSEYHTIISVEPAWTLFITWKYQGTWGFMVHGKKIPYTEYLKEKA